MKKRIKTDGVEGLLEIVKAVQKGEDPEEVLRQKEAARLAEEEEARRLEEERQEAEHEAQRKAAQEEAERKAAEKEAAREAARKAKAKKKTNKAESALMADSPKSRPEEDEFQEFSQKKDFEKESGEDFFDSQDEFEEDDDDFTKLLNSEEASLPQIGPALEKMKGGLQSLLGVFGGSKSKKKPKREAEETEETQKSQEAEEPESLLQSEKPESLLQPEEPQKESDLQPEEKKPREKTEDEIILDRILERNNISPDEIPDDEDEEVTMEPEGKKRSRTAGRNSVLAGVQDTILDFLDSLRQRGISKKEIGMIVTGLVLAVLVIAFVFKGIGSVMDQKRKSENVTADQGLTVTVEKEPQEWCCTYPLELKFKVSGENIKQVNVNGVNYLPNEQGMITVETGEYLLETSVTTENGTLSARIEVPRLDSQAPSVSAQKSENSIILTAADARSGIKKIRYAKVSAHTAQELPQYQEYTEPIAYESDMMYYFYAEDEAGNCSVPVKTTMETAREISFGDTEVSMFPGESKTLQLVTVPEEALLNNLRFESTDSNVVTIDKSGRVTAVAEGKTTVKAVADGVEQASCTIDVSRSRSVTISAIGDCTLGADESFNTMTNFNAFYTVNGGGYFFDHVNEILAGDDVTFANLEGTFTTETSRESKEYAFKGDPTYTSILQDGSIEVVTLANNHSSDYGAKSLEDTKGYLTEAGIDYCIGDTIAMKDVNGIRTAFVGIYVLADGMEREAQVKETIANAKELGAQLIIVAFHWGSEKAAEPDDTQVSLAHTAVDCGANLVVGHHPHVLQGIEKYNGAYIVYSLGNFCFGGNSTPSDMDTMIFRQTFTITDGMVMDDDQVEVIPCSISSTSNYNNYQPTLAEGTEADRILGRINEYSAVYGQTFTASSGL